MCKTRHILHSQHNSVCCDKIFILRSIPKIFGERCFCGLPHLPSWQKSDKSEMHKKKTKIMHEKTNSCQWSKLFAWTVIRCNFFIAALHVSVIWIDFYGSTFWWCRWFIRADEKSFLAQDEIEFFTRALRGRQQVSQKTRKQKQPKLSLTFWICLCWTGS